MRQDKHVFLTLDGLRGIAAIAVAFLHGALLYGMPVDGMPLERAHLAVDLFFLMSGVVIAHAYDRRIAGSMSVGQFMRARVIRLYPLYILGALFGIAVAAKDVFASPGPDAATPANFLFTLASNSLMIPAPLGAEPHLYPFNPPSWSLFLELVVNFAYVLAFPLLTNRRLVVIVAIAGIAFAYFSIVHGMLNPGRYWENLIPGLPRVFFSFPLGVLIYRLHSQGILPTIRVPMVLILGVPVVLMTLHPAPALGPLYDTAVILLLFPLIVWAGMCNQPVHGKGVYRVLGLISYPMYMLHMTVFAIGQFVAYRVTGSGTVMLEPWRLGGLIALLVALSWAVDRWYDGPVRRWMTDIFGRRS